MRIRKRHAEAFAQAGGRYDCKVMMVMTIYDTVAYVTLFNTIHTRHWRFKAVISPPEILSHLSDRCRGPKFGMSHIQLNAYPACAAIAVPLFLLFSSSRLPRMRFYLKLAKNNRIRILDIFLTETTLVTTENPGLLQLRSQILLIRAECGPGRNWDHDTGKGVDAFGCRKTLILESTPLHFGHWHTTY